MFRESEDGKNEVWRDKLEELLQSIEGRLATDTKLETLIAMNIDLNEFADEIEATGEGLPEDLVQCGRLLQHFAGVGGVGAEEFARLTDEAREKIQETGAAKMFVIGELVARTQAEKELAPGDLAPETPAEPEKAGSSEQARKNVLLEIDTILKHVKPEDPQWVLLQDHLRDLRKLIKKGATPIEIRRVRHLAENYEAGSLVNKALGGIAERALDSTGVDRQELVEAFNEKDIEGMSTGALEYEISGLEGIRKSRLLTTREYHVLDLMKERQKRLQEEEESSAEDEMRDAAEDMDQLIDRLNSGADVGEEEIKTAQYRANRILQDSKGNTKIALEIWGHLTSSIHRLDELLAEQEGSRKKKVPENPEPALAQVRERLDRGKGKLSEGTLRRLWLEIDRLESAADEDSRMRGDISSLKAELEAAMTAIQEKQRDADKEKEKSSEPLEAKLASTEGGKAETERKESPEERTEGL